MAVSGRKSSEFRESLTMGSAEDFEICCDPCRSGKLNAEAKGFCLNCQENLCKSCLDVHKRLQISKHHKVEDKLRAKASTATVQQPSQSVCTDVCIIHSNEVIKFFCRNHETLGCSDCVTLNHRNCRIDYIPDVCKDVTNSEEFKKTLAEVTEKLKQTDDFCTDTNTYRKSSGENITDTIKQIEDFQKSMNENLDSLKNRLVQNLKVVESAFDKNAHEALTRNDEVSSELMSVKVNLETSQTTRNDAQAFTTMKQAQSRLKTLNTSAYRDNLLAGKKRYKFEPNEALVDILSTTDGLGRIVTVQETQHVSSAHTLYSLSHDKDINVKTKSDTSACNVTGCSLFTSGKLVVTDFKNKKVKIVDRKKQSVVEEYTLSDHPFDVAVLPHDQVAVTLPYSSEIQILKTREKLTTLRNIKVNRQCCGITYMYHQDLLYVVCQVPRSVKVLDMQGSVQRDILLQSALNETFSRPYYINISKNLQQMYISDWDSNMVVSLTLQGEVTAVYKNNELMKPLGITVLEDGSLLVCCRDNGTIHHITADLKQGRKVTEGIKAAQSICYDSNSKTAYVGSIDCEYIRTFVLK